MHECSKCAGVARFKCRHCQSLYCGKECHMNDQLECLSRMISQISSLLLISGQTKRVRSEDDKGKEEEEESDDPNPRPRQQQAMSKLEQVLNILQTNPAALQILTRMLSLAELRRYEQASPEFREYISHNGRFWFYWLSTHYMRILYGAFRDDHPYTYQMDRNEEYVRLGRRVLQLRDQGQDRMVQVLRILINNDEVMQQWLRDSFRHDNLHLMLVNSTFRNEFWNNQRFWYNLYVVLRRAQNFDTGPYNINTNYREFTLPLIPAEVTYELRIVDSEFGGGGHYYVNRLPTDESFYEGIRRTLEERGELELEAEMPSSKPYQANEMWIWMASRWEITDYDTGEILTEDEQWESYADEIIFADIPQVEPQDLMKRRIACIQLMFEYKRPTFTLDIDYTSESDLVPFRGDYSDLEWMPESFVQATIPREEQNVLRGVDYWPDIWMQGDVPIFGDALDNYEIQWRMEDETEWQIIPNIDESPWLRIRSYLRRIFVGRGDRAPWDTDDEEGPELTITVKIVKR